MKTRLLALLASVFGLLVMGVLRGQSTAPLPVRSAAGQTQSAASAQFQHALPGYQYQFPRDHFDHPDYQTEWWYYTGNLRAADGHRFGFELTFFRVGNTAVPAAQSSSPWSLRNLYMAHLALSDISGQSYYTDERLNRAGPGIAGISAETQTVWNANWQTVIAPDMHHLVGISEHFSIDLHAVPRKGPVVHGDNGVSQKSVNDASHYISFTSMATTGTVQLNGRTYQVKGDTWMDHEFFTSPATSTEVGWDWLSLQLADSTELMLYRLRHRDGSVDPFSSGSYIDKSGKVTHLALGDFSMTATGKLWKSKVTGATYPIAWRVSIPKLQLDLTVATPLESQEFVSRFGPSYWEGAVDAHGRLNASAISGSGYLEMTGYDDRAKFMISR